MAFLFLISWFFKNQLKIRVEKQEDYSFFNENFPCKEIKSD